jgi:uroporphyrinogen decarboxylase
VTETLKNDRLLRALRRETVDATPVWLMRQAGRYLPEYREIRAQAGSFMALCGNPELACRVTMQPLERFDLDAAILFSDILTIPDAMGLGLYFEPGEGPRFERPVRDAGAIRALGIPDPEQELGYVPEAVRLIRRELAGSVPLIGFAGSPWTLATYMVEGGSSKNFARIKALLFDEPALAHALLEKLADAVAAYLGAQVAAGAQALMVFDTWGGALQPTHYRAFSLAYLGRVVEGLRGYPGGKDVPVVLFTKGGGQYLEELADSGADAVGLDWTTNLDDARMRVGDRVALQGNLDPCALYASPSVICEQVGEVLAAYGHGPGHVFNLGHGVHPEMDPEHIGVLVDAVHELSRPYHADQKGNQSPFPAKKGL